MTHEITLKEKTPVTHDVNRYVFSRPEGLEFHPGQATELTLEKSGWQDEGRPFTFTSQPDDKELEFVIKSYPEHDGVTEQLAGLKPGDKLKMADPFGAIEDKGAGTFIAAGAGITPFIPILRHRAAEGSLEDCQLIYTNKTEDDIILREEWAGMEGLSLAYTVTDHAGDSVPKAMLDEDYLRSQVPDLERFFYICGPQGFVDDIRNALGRMGAAPERIITEEGW